MIQCGALPHFFNLWCDRNDLNLILSSVTFICALYMRVNNKNKTLLGSSTHHFRKSLQKKICKRVYNEKCQGTLLREVQLFSGQELEGTAPYLQVPIAFSLHVVAPKMAQCALEHPIACNYAQHTTLWARPAATSSTSSEVNAGMVLGRCAKAETANQAPQPQGIRLCCAWNVEECQS